MPLLKYRGRYDAVKDRRLSLSMIVTDSCNLDCSYCYEKKSERKKGVMNISVAKEVITYYTDRDDGFDKVSIEFFGGEPLLAFSLIKEIVEWFFSRSWKKKVFFALVTNGTILTEEMKEWFLKHKKHMTVSFTIDGCKKAHDINRCNSYDKVKSNLPFFLENWPTQPSKMSINEKTIPYIAESVIHLEELGINFHGGPILENIWGDTEQKKELLKTYEDQLAILVDYYIERPHLFPPQPLFPLLPEYLGGNDSEIEKLKKESVRFCGSGVEMATIDVDGKRYPCHRFLPLCTGKPAPQNDVNTHTSWKPDKCAQCKLVISCPTCVGFNYQVNGDPQIRTTFHCEAYKLGIKASCKVEALRLKKMKKSEWEKLSKKEKDHQKIRLDAIIHVIEKGL